MIWKHHPKKDAQDEHWSAVSSSRKFDLLVVNTQYSFKTGEFRAWFRKVGVIGSWSQVYGSFATKWEARTALLNAVSKL